MLRHIFKSETATPVDELIDHVLLEMDKEGPQSPEYPALLSNLERLYALRDKKTPEPISRDSIALIAGNLMGILLIVAYEQKHVMTSKGFSQIIRPLK